MPIVIDRRLQSCSDEELRRIARQLFDIWQVKGSAPFDKMPRWFVKDVEKLRTELARRGVQLRLF